MKIAINASVLNHNERSGLLVYIDNLLRELAEIDSSNEYFLFFTSLRRKPNDMHGPQQNNFTRAVLPMPNVKFPGRSLFFNSIILPSFLKSKKCSVYHAPCGFNLPKEKGVKKILTVHDLRTLKINDSFYPQDIKALKKSISYADRIITISEATKTDILEHFSISPNKIVVIYIGVDDRFQPGNRKNQEINPTSKRYGLSQKYFFSVGGVPRKNVERLIRAYSLFKYRKDFLLAIGGEGSNGPWSSTYSKLITQLGLENNIRMLGYIPDVNLPLLYASAECFVFPSLYEGFGIPILEAMKSGIPVITSNVSSLPEIGGDAALYVNPYNEEEIANAMEKVVENKLLKETLVEKGLRRAKLFSWRKMTQETLGVYNAAV